MICLGLPTLRPKLSKNKFKTVKEKDIQTIFGKKNKLDGVFELKLLKGSSIRFDAVKDHQIEALMAVSGEEGLYHKINDLPVFPGCKTRFASPKPFDCFYLKNIPAYIVICVYTPRKKKLFCYIMPEAWTRAKINSKKKSINREEIEDITHWLMIA